LIKLCGLSRAADVVAAEKAGADFIGLVIEYPRSPRSVTRGQGQGLVRASHLPAVAVVVDPDHGLVTDIAGGIRPAAIQLSGREPPGLVTELRAHLPQMEVWKVLHLDPYAPAEMLDALVDEAESYRLAGVDKIMVDARIEDLPGGTGRSVNWRDVRRVIQAVAVPVILAGGLTHANVRGAIRAAGASGVDVSSGTESSPGVKDPLLMARFVTEARGGFREAERVGT